MNGWKQPVVTIIAVIIALAMGVIIGTTADLSGLKQDRQNLRWSMVKGGIAEWKVGPDGNSRFSVKEEFRRR